MIVKNYGLFWRVDEVNWNPGGGNPFNLFGRHGMIRPKIRLADFRNQRGIYILYGNYGPYYVGLTRERGLGLRLKDHLSDRHDGKWDRFSWFGFRAVNDESDNIGVRQTSEEDEEAQVNTNSIIGDIEALLIKAMGTHQNILQMNFADGNEWKQVKIDEIETYKGRVLPCQ